MILCRRHFVNRRKDPIQTFQPAYLLVPNDIPIANYYETETKLALAMVVCCGSTVDSYGRKGRWVFQPAELLICGWWLVAGVARGTLFVELRVLSVKELVYRAKKTARKKSTYEY